MPQVSVIMPSYNRAKIITKAINSVLNQNFKDFELVVIDDGSTDDTKAVISKISDKRVIYRYVEHHGTSAARNKGLSVATGRFIAFLDTDNYWHPNFLEVMTREVQSPYLMGYCSENMLLISRGKDLTNKVIGRKVRNVEYNPIKLTYTNYIDINSVLINRGLFKNIGMFDEGLKTLEDWDLFVRIALKYPFKIKQIDQVLVDYYFFTKDILSTVTNSFTSDQEIKSYFRLKVGKGDTATIIRKTKQFLGEN